MPDSGTLDWKSMVRERLGNMQLDAYQQEEIVREIASHLDELYEELCAKGLCKTGALERSLSEINWRQLSRKIQTAKREEMFMNNRTKQFWLPAMVSLAISEGVLLLVTVVVGRDLRISMMGPKMTYIPWLISLVIAGNAGAYLSRRGGSGWRTLLAASLFPAYIGLAFVLVGIAITLTTGARIFAQPQWLYAIRALGVGVFVPAIALLLGSLPFVRQPGVRA